MAAPAYQPTDRRPIASRRSPVWIAVSRRLAAAGVSANAISVLGMFAALAAGTCLCCTREVPELWARVLWFAAAVLCPLRLLANLLDGMVAIERGLASPVGELYNEVPDRVSDAAVLIGLGYGAGAWPALGFSAAVLAVIVAYVRAAAKVAGAAQDYCGPMAKQQRMVVVTAAAAVMGATPSSWHVVLKDHPLTSIPNLALLVVIIGCVATVVRRLVRAARALRGARA